MARPGRIRTAQSNASDARLAVQEFHSGVRQAAMAQVVFFCSSRYDLDALADEMNRRFAGVKLIGCTTAGEIGPGGYSQSTLSGASFPADSFVAVSGVFDRLQQFDFVRGQSFIDNLLQKMETKLSPDGDNGFAFLMIDGLSVREELAARTFQNALGRIALIGGSAGDDLELARTQVFAEGAFHSDSAVLMLAATSLPFSVFKTQHFVTDGESLVVTRADPAHRIVNEINGRPAAAEFARAIGSSVAALASLRFSGSPVVVVIDGTDYVRSIQKANADGSLSFYCAIDEGLVLRVAHGQDLLAKLQRTFSQLRQQIGPPQAVLACDCILRRLEIERDALTREVGDIFRANNAFGLCTYGEQFGRMHVNQTLTGIAFGAPPGSIAACSRRN